MIQWSLANDLIIHAHIMRRRQWHPTPVLLPGKSHGWRSLVGYSPQGRNESDMTEGIEHARTVISKEKYMFVLHSQFWNRAAKNLGSSWEESNKGVFCYVNEVTFGSI